MSADLDDLLDDAATAASPEEARQALRAAERLVERAYDHVKLARGWVALDPDEARRHVELAVRGAGLEPWTYRHAAEVLAGPLGDRDGAAEVLRRGEEMPVVDAPLGLPRPAYVMTLLGAGWRAILGDDAGYRRCVDAACPGRPTLEDRCTIARALDDLGDAAAAAEQLAEAEAELAREVAAAGPSPGWSTIQRHWTVAVAHDACRDHVRARAVLARAEACASDTSSDLALAHAWHGRRRHDGEAPARVEALLDRARGRATTSEEALAAADVLAELALDGHGDAEARPAREAALRTSLERAASLATGRADRIAIARAFRRLLGDEARASAIGPRGLRPADLLVRRHALDGWPRDPTPLVDHLRARLDDAALEPIAAADHGSDREAHLAVLKDVRDTGLVPHPLGAVREVLQLTQHGTGRGVDHAARALCCALLLIETAADPAVSQGAMEATLAVLCESGLALDGAAGPLLQFLVAVVEGLDEVEHLFGLLAVVITALAIDPRDARAAALAQRLLDGEPAAAGGDPPHPEAGFLLRTTYFDGRHALWRELIDRFLAPVTDAPAAVRELARQLAAAR